MQRQRTPPWHLPWSAAAAAAPRWVAAWCAAQQAVEPDNRLPEPFTQQAALRQVLRLSLPGRRWRLRLSNRFGDAPLEIAAAAVAPSRGAGTAAIDRARQHTLRFDGQAQLHLPPGQEACSDAFEIELPAGQDLAVTLALTRLPPEQTGHPGSRTTSYARPGHEGLTAADWPSATAVTHWYLICDVEAWCEAPTLAWVAIGDSITDGRGSTTDGNDRWPDRLRERLAALAASPAADLGPIAVVHTGLGGNRVLHDRVGPGLASRFERDVLQRAGVGAVLLAGGINDLGTRREWLDAGRHRASAKGRPPLPAAAREAFFEALTQAWATLAARARRQGLAVIGATLTPLAGFTGYDGHPPGADDETDRQRLNAWIRTAPCFDAVADFDAALRDPADGSRVRDGLHDGDRLHPSPAGLQALADAVPLPARP